MKGALLLLGIVCGLCVCAADSRAGELRARYDSWVAALSEPLWQPERGDK